MSEQPIHVGIRFSYSENWIGGSYYYLNLLSSLKQLEEARRPRITVIAEREADLDHVRSLAYPDAVYLHVGRSRPNAPLRIMNRIGRKIAGNRFYLGPRLQAQIDLLFAGSLQPFFENVPHQLFWIPDFQEEHLPEFFTPRQLENRRRVRGNIAASARQMVFSSQSARDDFEQFYPDCRAARHVLNFAVTHPEYASLDLESLRERYGLGDAAYFFSPNQLWKHKNQPVVLEALALLKASSGLDFIVCFSGKEEDGRNPTYVPSLKAKVVELGLEDNVKFLGFIDRRDQLRLMQGALGILQPSLFEGWSTVVEDAKAMDQIIIASDLAVHHEQLGAQGLYFDPRDPEALAERLSRVRSGHAGVTPRFHYSKAIRDFGVNFLAICENVVR